MTQKILAKAAGLPSVKPGQLIRAKLNMVLGNDITSPVAINEFEKNGFFKKLSLDKNGIWIRFNSLQDKQYCINYGVWLELYVYVAAASSGAFEDVKLGTMIDWNVYDGLKIGGNEIDVMLIGG